MTDNTMPSRGSDREKAEGDRGAGAQPMRSRTPDEVDLAPEDRADSGTGDCADEHDTPRRYDQPASEDPAPTAKI